MGELAGNVWPRFFYSLSFKNWPPSDQSTSLRKNIPGTWIAATARAASEFVFAANGRYGDAAASQQSNRINSTEALQTTQAYFGKGAFTLRGNTITLTPDNQRERPETGFIRVEEESADDGRPGRRRCNYCESARSTAATTRSATPSRRFGCRVAPRRGVPQPLAYGHRHLVTHA